MFRLKMYPAKNGDAFLVDADGTYILIDAGFASTYHDFIAPDLAQVVASGGRLDLVACSHIDADHIGGLLEFFSRNGAPDARGIEVDAVWHNSLRSLAAPEALPSAVADQMVLEAIQRRGFPRVISSPEPISARQGSSLAKLLRRFGYTWNSGAGTGSITAGNAPVALSNGVTVHAIGPKSTRLEELRDLWLKEVRKLGYRGSSQPDDLIDDAYEMWCAMAPAPPLPKAALISSGGSLRLADVYTPDTSIPNGSSISLILGAGRERLLFLGDAWAEDVVASLRELQAEGTHIFDVIKVSHHGSARNTSVELLSIADSPRFLISTDGTRHGHPDFEVLAEIVDRPAPFKRQLFFNYETSASARLKSHVSRSGTGFSVHVVGNDWIAVGEKNND